MNDLICLLKLYTFYGVSDGFLGAAECSLPPVLVSVLAACSAQ